MTSPRPRAASPAMWTPAVALLSLATAAPASAQVSFTNLVETRIGRDPDDGRGLPPDLVPSASRSSLFDQLSLEWTSGPLRLGFRFETYTASDSLTAHYGEFVRRYAAWSSPNLEVTAGNYDVMFGRGLALRAFELPGVVREEFGTPQFGDSRDLFGAMVRAHAPRAELTAIFGEPHSADLDPTRPRRGQVEGATASIEAIRSVRVGGNYLRLDSSRTGPGSRPEIGGGFIQVGFDPYLRHAGLGRLSLDTYIEYDRVNALALPPSVSSPQADPEHGSLLYVSQTAIVDPVVPGVRWGLSWEYKNYQNYELGVNEPPTLVREHPWVLLNRSTHVLDPLQEEGYQLESRFNVRSRADLVLNWSRAENSRSRRFHEGYAELSGHAGGRRLTLFADTAQDDVEFVRDRDTIGAHAQAPVAGPHSLEIELERQDVDREIGTLTQTYQDRYAALSYSWAGHVAIGFVHQSTDDPNEASDPATGEVSRRAYDSLNATVDIGDHHQLAFFWGQRRGGLACTAGTCYKVRGFDGVSGQLVSRF